MYFHVTREHCDLIYTNMDILQKIYIFVGEFALIVKIQVGCFGERK